VDELRIPLDRIPDEGLDIDFEITAESIKLEKDEWPPLSQGKLVGRLERLGSQEAVFRGRVIGEFTLECSLGLAQFQFRVDEPMSVYFQVPPAEAFESGSEVECKEEDLEVFYLQNSEMVDLHIPTRDQLCLGIPPQARCPDQCLGEDPGMCQRLKEGKGVGEEEETDPRWASLKQWSDPQN
jgi:uncharacterized metal-binding protein YceD (DUF177 family)